MSPQITKALRQIGLAALLGGLCAAGVLAIARTPDGNFLVAESSLFATTIAAGLSIAAVAFYLGFLAILAKIASLPYERDPFLSILLLSMLAIIGSGYLLSPKSKITGKELSTTEHCIVLVIAPFAAASISWTWGYIRKRRQTAEDFAGSMK